MKFIDMVNIYLDSEGQTQTDVSAYNENTFDDFADTFKEKFKRHPVIYELFNRYNRGDKRKFIFDLWVKDYDNSILSNIVALNYNPDLYRDYFLHSYLFKGTSEHEYLRYCMGWENTRMGKDKAGYERLIGDQTYIERYCKMFDQERDFFRRMEIPLVDYRYMVVDKLLSAQDLLRYCVMFGVKIKETLKAYFELTEEKIEESAKEVSEKLSEEDLIEERLNHKWFNEAVKWMNLVEERKKGKNLNEVLKALFNDKQPILCNQKMIDIDVARDFWCAFLLKQSQIHYISEESNKAKDRCVFDKELCIRRDSIEDAYKYALKSNKPRDFVVRKNYLQHILQKVGLSDRESAMFYPAWWLLGDNYISNEEAFIVLQRDVYNRHLRQKRKVKGERTRRDCVSYKMSNMRKKIVELSNDESIHDMAIILQAMTSKEHANFMYSVLPKNIASEFFDVYIWLHDIASYLLLIYDEETFIRRFDYFWDILSITIDKLCEESTTPA